MNGKKETVILLPVDGSDCCMRAAQHCAWFARATGGRVVVLHVQPEIDDLTFQAIGPEKLRKHREDSAREATQPALDVLASVPHEVVIANGEPAEAIGATAEERGCTHVIMGSRGLGRISGIFMGSVAMKTFHIVKVPITYVP